MTTSSRIPARRIAAASLLLALMGAGATVATASAEPSHAEPAGSVAVSTWAPTHGTPSAAMAEDTAYLDGVLFDSTSAQIVLAASAAGALVMAARAATRKEG